MPDSTEYSPPINFVPERETPTNAYAIRSATKITKFVKFFTNTLRC